MINLYKKVSTLNQFKRGVYMFNSYIPKNEPGIVKNSGLFFYESSELAKSIYNYIYWGGQYTVTYPYCVKRDYMNSFIAFIIMEGELFFDYLGKQFSAKKGELVFLDCKEKNHYYAKDTATFQFIHFSGSSIQSYYDTLYKLHGPKHTSAIAEKIMHTLYSLIQYQEKDQDFSISMEIHRLFGELIEQAKDKQSFRYSPTARIPTEIQQAIEYIHHSYSQTIVVNDLAKLANLSTYHFSRQFKKFTGKSPYNYLQTYRLIQAKNLLVSTNLSVEAISEQCGFNNSSHFIKFFSKSTDGITPKKFRALKL